MVMTMKIMILFKLGDGVDQLQSMRYSRYRGIDKRNQLRSTDLQPVLIMGSPLIPEKLFWC